MKQFILFFILGVILNMFLILIFQEDISSNAKTVGFYIVVLIFTFIGYLLNLIPYKHFFKRTHSKTYPSIGYIIAIIGFSVVMFTIKFNNWHHEKYYGNIEQNKSAMKYLLQSDQEYVKIAFLKLESVFSNPNDFRIHRFIVSKKDTVIGKNIETIYSVYFRYYLYQNYTKEYLAKVSVFDNRSNIILFNQDGSVQFEDLYPEENIGYYDKPITDSIRSILNNLPDSTRNKIRELILPK